MNYNIHFLKLYRRGDQTTRVDSCDTGHKKNKEWEPWAGGGGVVLLGIRGGDVAPVPFSKS